MTPSMTCTQFETILPQLLDDASADAAMTPIVRAHLDACADCRALFDDLAHIRASAAALPALQPSRDLWKSIEARIQAPVVPLNEGVEFRRPRRTVTWRTVGIAAAVLVVANLAAAYAVVLRSRSAVRPSEVVASSRAVGTPDTALASMFESLDVSPEPYRAGPMVSLAATQFQGVQQQPRQREAARLVYDREIARLRAVVDSNKRRLDPATAALLERNLRIIDTAIVQCNEALQHDANSAFLIGSLNSAYQTKVRLLRLAAAAVSRE
jgi:hypothetical protein